MHAVTPVRPCWIFFDLDGTLADSHEALYDVYRDFLSRFRRGASRDEFDRLNGLSLPEIVAELRTAHSLPADERRLTGLYREAMTNAYAWRLQPIAGADGLLRDLRDRGLSLALVSSAQRRVAEPFLERQGWRERFEHCVWGDDVESGKPDPAIYAEALARSSTEPNAALVVEDSPNGVRAGAVAGIFVVGVARSYPAEALRAAGAGQVLASVTDLPALLDHE